MKTRKKIAFKIFQWLITAMVALIILIPIYWIFISSIKPNRIYLQSLLNGFLNILP